MVLNSVIYADLRMHESIKIEDFSLLIGKYKTVIYYEYLFVHPLTGTIFVGGYSLCKGPMFADKLHRT